MRTFLLFVLFVGVVLVVMNERINDSPPRIEYRYIPRDLDTYLRETTLAHVPFQAMSNTEDAWMTRAF